MQTNKRLKHELTQREMRLSELRSALTHIDDICIRLRQGNNVIDNYQELLREIPIAYELSMRPFEGGGDHLRPANLQQAAGVFHPDPPVPQNPEIRYQVQYEVQPPINWANAVIRPR